MIEPLEGEFRPIEDPVSESIAPAAPGPVTYTIKVLSTDTDPAGREVRTVLFQRASDGEAIEISAETDAGNLLAKLPDLLEAALSIQRALWPAQRTVSGLRSGFFPRLAEESRLVRWLTEGVHEHGDPAVAMGAPPRSHDGGSAPQSQWGLCPQTPAPPRVASGDRAPAAPSEVERRRLVREAMIVRDVAWEALRQVLPPARRGEVDALVAVHETPAELATSMEGIASLVTRMLGDDGDAVILAACDIDAAYAAALRRQAARLRAAEGGAGARTEPPRRGGWLRLIGMAYRALSTEAFLTVARAGAPPRARGRGALGPGGRRGAGDASRLG